MNYSWRETEGGKTTTKQYVLQFHEGYLTGKVKDLKLDMQIFSFAFDENHQPNGIWTCRLNRPSEQWTFCLRYADGKLQESYTENMATGDRTGQRTGVGADDGEVGRPCYSLMATRRCPSAAVSIKNNSRTIPGLSTPRATSMGSWVIKDTITTNR